MNSTSDKKLNKGNSNEASYLDFVEAIETELSKSHSSIQASIDSDEYGTRQYNATQL